VGAVHPGGEYGACLAPIARAARSGPELDQCTRVLGAARRLGRDIDRVPWAFRRTLVGLDGAEHAQRVMSTHMRGKGSGLPFAQRVANVWEFKDEKLWRATLYRNPVDALRVTEVPQREQ
jgi:ketosteroid isomerase-like protein